MATYTYKDFLKAAEKNGYSQGNGFSTADWSLAQENADAGMSLLNYKNDWRNAKTAEERAKANTGANQIRSLYGHYSGGLDGSQFYLDKPSPGSFTPETKPTFSYDLESDPVYAAYRKQYAREGQRASQNALGSAAAATGGIPSSYAATAASQAGDYYAAQLTDKAPELYQQAYNRYLNELAQYNTDRNFQYGQHLDEINAKTSDRQEAMQNALYGAQLGDYKLLKDLGYKVDNLPEDYEKKYNEAVLAAQMGDYSKLQKDFGINPSNGTVNQSMLYNLALQKAAQGDYSYLNRLVNQYFG